MRRQYLRALLTLLPRRPTQSLQIAFWWITRRRVRALAHLRAAVAETPWSYRLWRAINEPAGYHPTAVHDDNYPLLDDNYPLLEVHLHLATGHSFDMATRSLLAQTLPHWSLRITAADASTPGLPIDKRIYPPTAPFATRADALAHVLAVTRARYIVPLSADSALTPSAVQRYVDAIQQDGSTLYYADQDEHGRRGQRCCPWLKPDWDADLFLAQDYLSAACAIPVATAQRVGVDTSWPDEVVVYGLLTRLLLGRGAVSAHHLPFVAVSTPRDAWREPRSARTAVVRAATGLPTTDGPFGTVVTHYPLPSAPPRVSVIVPTRDRVDLLEVCAKGVLDNTDYPDIELVIVDNDSVEPETAAFFERVRQDPRVNLIRWPHHYNYSAINNFAAAMATGSYLCLLNNDTEVIEPSWLRTMMTYAVRPDVGAVGAKLLYPDLSIQHAGVVIGMGNAAGHAHRGLPKDEPGWFAQTFTTRGATAVTAACLVVASEKFAAVSGLDADNLAIAYNDVDLCLKLRKAGWRNIYAAQATLIHHESKSRGQDFAPQNLDRYLGELKVFQQRWRTIGFEDPTHHQGLDLATERYRLRL